LKLHGHAIRDSVAKSLKQRRKRTDRCEDPTQQLDEQLHSRLADDGIDAIGALGAVDTVRKARAVIAARLCGARRGSAQWHVLSNFEPLATGALELSALADAVGMADSTLSDAFAAERKAVRRAIDAA